MEKIYVFEEGKNRPEPEAVPSTDITITDTNDKKEGEKEQ